MNKLYYKELTKKAAIGWKPFLEGLGSFFKTTVPGVAGTLIGGPRGSILGGLGGAALGLSGALRNIKTPELREGFQNLRRYFTSQSLPSIFKTKMEYFKELKPSLFRSGGLSKESLTDKVVSTLGRKNILRHHLDYKKLYRMTGDPEVLKHMKELHKSYKKGLTTKEFFTNEYKFINRKLPQWENALNLAREEAYDKALKNLFSENAWKELYKNPHVIGTALGTGLNAFLGARSWQAAAQAAANRQLLKNIGYGAVGAAGVYGLGKLFGGSSSTQQPMPMYYYPRMY